MAYMNPAKKARLAPGIKAVLKKYGLKGTISVRDHCCLVLKLKPGGIDFMANYNENDSDRHQPWYRGPRTSLQLAGAPHPNSFTGVAYDALCELSRAMNVGNHDNSNSMVDYFDVGHYTNIYIGY